MFTRNSLIKEINELPVEKLDEAYEFIHSLNTEKKKATRKKIMAFAGAFADMTKKDFKELKDYNKQTRVDLFSRKTML